MRQALRPATRERDRPGQRARSLPICIDQERSTAHLPVAHLVESTTQRVSSRCLRLRHGPGGALAWLSASPGQPEPGTVPPGQPFPVGQEKLKGWPRPALLPDIA